MARPSRSVRPASVALAALVLAVGVSTASAHVEVLPTTGTVEQAQEFTVRVPTERTVPTTAVQVTFPSQVTVYAFAPPPAGWRMTTVQRGGRFVAVRYTGGAIPPNQYLDFHFLGTPTAYGTAVWKALQTYADGKVKPWTGPPEAPGAASAESGPTAPGPAPAVEISAPGAAPAASNGGSGDDSGAAVWLGVIAIGGAALALVGVGLLWASRPMALPSDDDDGDGDATGRA